MAEAPNEKQRIGTALSATRSELNTIFLLVRQNLDIRRISMGVAKKHLWVWMAKRFLTQEHRFQDLARCNTAS